jgi:hypothetical protein
VSHEI